MGMLPMKGSDDSLSFFHSSASASQYSISLFATAARSRHMPSCAAKLFVALMMHPPLTTPLLCQRREEVGLTISINVPDWVIHTLFFLLRQSHYLSCEKLFWVVSLTS